MTMKSTDEILFVSGLQVMRPLMDCVVPLGFRRCQFLLHSFVELQEELWCHDGTTAQHGRNGLIGKDTHVRGYSGTNTFTPLCTQTG